MNLFYLDKDIDKCARFHIDAHCTKMPLEVAEMLCMATVVNDIIGFVPRRLTDKERSAVDKVRKEQMALGPPEVRKYHYPGRLSHYNHPSTIWVRSSLENYAWTTCYGHAVDTERQRRNGHNKTHKALGLVYPYPIPDKLENHGFTPFALAMKDFAKDFPHLYNEDDPVTTYREFYKYDKRDFASWKNTETPHWWV